MYIFYDSKQICMFLRSNSLLVLIERWNMNSIELQTMNSSSILMTFYSCYTITLCCIRINMKSKNNVFSFASYITAFIQYLTIQLFYWEISPIPTTASNQSGLWYTGIEKNKHHNSGRSFLNLHFLCILQYW